MLLDAALLLLLSGKVTKTEEEEKEDRADKIFVKNKGRKKEIKNREQVDIVPYIKYGQYQCGLLHHLKGYKSTSFSCWESSHTSRLQQFKGKGVLSPLLTLLSCSEYLFRARL